MKKEKNVPLCGTCLTPLVIKHDSNGVAQSVYCERCRKFLYEEDKVWGKIEKGGLK